MLNKIIFAAFAFCINAASYAYVVGTDFTIINKTDIPMVLVINQPNEQSGKVINIPAHETSHVGLQNGDSTGLLYQMSNAPFKLVTANGNGKPLIQGRIVYYVGATLNNKYSFLNAVSAADGLTLDLDYTCGKHNWYDSFNNTITILGKPTRDLKIKKFPTDFSCQGLKSSTFNETTRQYIPLCFNTKKSVFTEGEKDYESAIYSNIYDTYLVYNPGSMPLQGMLDNRIGQSFCETWLGWDDDWLGFA